MSSQKVRVLDLSPWAHGSLLAVGATLGAGSVSSGGFHRSVMVRWCDWCCGLRLVCVHGTTGVTHGLSAAAAAARRNPCSCVLHVLSLYDK